MNEFKMISDKISQIYNSLPLNDQFKSKYKLTLSYSSNFLKIQYFKNSVPSIEIKASVDLKIAKKWLEDFTICPCLHYESKAFIENQRILKENDRIMKNPWCFVINDYQIIPHKLVFKTDDYVVLSSINSKGELNSIKRYSSQLLNKTIFENEQNAKDVLKNTINNHMDQIKKQMLLLETDINTYQTHLSQLD